MPALPHTLILDLHAQREAHRRAQRPRTAGLGCMLLGWVVLGLLVLASYIDPDPPGTAGGQAESTAGSGAPVMALFPPSAAAWIFQS